MRSPSESRREQTLNLSLNGQQIRALEGKSVLEAALENGIYIPHLCFYPGLGPAGACQPSQRVFRGEQAFENDPGGEPGDFHLCLVEIGGQGRISHACTTPVEESMNVLTETMNIREQRRAHLARILETHPHVCLSCGLAEGCNRKLCSVGIPEGARCCWKFGNCELQRIAGYIGVVQGAPYLADSLSLLDDNPLFIRNYALCIHCLRCVVACRGVAGREAMGFVYRKARPFVGTKAPSLKESGCKFCLACVDVCPTGALREKDPTKKKSRERLGLAPPTWPPEKMRWLLLNKENLKGVPRAGGVYRLFDGDRELTHICGVEDLKRALEEKLERAEGVNYFQYEEDEMFTMRERQLIQQYIKKHGKIPTGNDIMDELF